MIITWRARSLAAAAALGLAVGLILRKEAMALCALTLLLWLGLEWLNFAWRTAEINVAFSQARRRLDEQTRPAHVLVVDQPVEVDVEIHAARRLAGLRCVLEDSLPQELTVVEGSSALTVPIQGGETLRWRYVANPAVTGKITLPGLQLTVSDPQGLFRLQRFAPLRQELTIWPFLVRPQATVSVLKQQNVQMLPGAHRSRRPGISTELLGIRDYRPGDPPRTIAWKATARLGRLMTCEYESEVPVRATIVADLSPRHFVGRPGPARADRIIAAAASIARLLLADGDPVASLTVSRGEQTWLPHGAGERHLARLLLRWLSFTRPLSVDRLHVDALTPLAWTCAFRRFPELFDSAVNRPRVRMFMRGRLRQLARQRQQLALALTEIYDGEPGLGMRLRFDDRLYRVYCRRLLEEHRGLVDLTLLPDEPTSKAADEQLTTDAIAQGILTGVARASDNELFVIVAALPEARSNRERLLEAVRVARAQYHRILMVDVTLERVTPQVQDPVARYILAEAAAAPRENAYAEFERELIRLGGKVAQLEDVRLLEKVAAEIEILQSGRSRAAGGGR